MGFYALTGLINAIGSLVIGVFVFGQNRKSDVHRRFFLFTLAVAFWAFSYYYWQVASTASAALFWSRSLMAGTIFIPVTYLHFVLAFLRLTKTHKKLLDLSYLLFFIFFLFNFTPLFVNRVEPTLHFKYWPKPGPVFHPFLFLWFVYISYATYLLFKAHRNARGLRRVQIRYLLVGMLIGYAGGLTNYFLWYDIPISPIGNGLVIFNVLILAYAILKHHLLDIRVIATEIFTASLILILFINIFTYDTVSQLILNIFVFIGAVFFGVLLINSVLKEIRAREELKSAYEELKKLDVAKTEFISIASHQLRTPLTIIKGYISMILEGTYGNLSKKVKRPLENVYQSNERLIKLVNDLLTVSKVETGKIETNFDRINLEEMISGLLDEFEIRAKEKNLKLKFVKTKKRLPKLFVDKNKIRQVILNLVDNAIRYTNKGEIVISCELRDGNYRIMVKDTGEGMTSEEAAKVFNSFSRGSAGMKFWTEGVGLGLYVAKKFVELHNGRIWAKSEGKGKGSTFYIELPLRPH